MKKYGLFKTLGILILLLVIGSYILPGRQGEILYTGLLDPVINLFGIVLPNFSYVILFILVVGGFYGLLNKVPAYKKLLDNIVTKVKKLNKKFIYIIIIIFAVLASLTGMSLELIVFVPFIASIILLLGYDKLVAVSATIVSILIGYVGGIFVTFTDPNTSAVTTYDTFIGTESAFANAFPRLLLLFIGIGALIYFVDRHIKATSEKKVKYELNDNSELLINEIKGKYKDIKTWPLIIILLLLFIVLIIGMIPWQGLFNIDIFIKFHEWIMGLNIKEFAIFPTIISSSLPALGAWNVNGNPWYHFIIISVLLLFASLLIALVNKVKFNDLIEGQVEGFKKIFPATVLIVIAYTVLVCAYNNGFLEKLIADSKEFNYAISSGLAVLGTILNVDITYIVLGCFSPLVNLITDESLYEVVAVLFQGIYGIVSIVGPTSLILIFALSYFDVPYMTWLKYIWRFILYMVIILALVALLVVLL